MSAARDLTEAVERCLTPEQFDSLCAKAELAGVSFAEWLIQVAIDAPVTRIPHQVDPRSLEPGDFL